MILLGDSLLDAQALYFVSYEGLVNTASYQQSGILTWAGHQYAAWYTADRTAVLARRALPVGAWETLRLPHRLSVDDSHNTISLGVSPADGRLHVAMDAHDSPVHYLKSEAGLVTQAPERAWEAARFGAVQRRLDGVDPGGMSYPRFVLAPDNRLQLSYRTGRSGDGTMELAEYGSAGPWIRLGRWSSAAGGYTANGVTSTSRNLYLHGIGYDRGGRLHAAFTWREGDAGVLGHPGGLPNHDTGYVYSDDRGRLWRTGDGRVAGPVAVTTPGHVVDPLGVDHALINQESQALDSAGNPHVIISYVPGGGVTDFAGQRRTDGRAFHLRRDPAGGWTKTQIPVPLAAFGRSRLVLDAADDAYVVLPQGRIVAATKAAGYTDWVLHYTGAELDAFGEVLVDEYRVRAEGVLSIMYQKLSVGSQPSQLRVIDFRLT